MTVTAITVFKALQELVESRDDTSNSSETRLANAWAHARDVLTMAGRDSSKGLVTSEEDTDPLLQKQIRDLNIKLQAMAKPAIQMPLPSTLCMSNALINRDHEWLNACQKHGIEVLQ